MPLTKKEYNEKSFYLNNYVLRFLNRSYKECIVESEVSSIEQIQSSGRLLTDLIAENAHHPLMSTSLVVDMLNNNFSKNWHSIH